MDVDESTTQASESTLLTESHGPRMDVVDSANQATDSTDSSLPTESAPSNLSTISGGVSEPIVLNVSDLSAPCDSG
jgi:hypothetical protein